MTRHQRAKRARRGDRSFQPSSAGKGDGDRTTDVDAYRANYDEINWGHGKRPKFRPIIHIREKKERLPLEMPRQEDRQRWSFDWSADV